MKPNFKLFMSFAGSGLLLLGLVGVALAGHGHGHGYGYGHGAPEIDPGSLGSGLALLAGSGLLLVERYRRRKSG